MTPAFGGQYSIQLSYECSAGAMIPMSGVAVYPDELRIVCECVRSYAHRGQFQRLYVLLFFFPNGYCPFGPQILGCV
jgi:hypothetical protein